MSMADDDIDRLARAVLGEAQGEADEILGEAKARAETVRQAARSEAGAERKEIMARAAEEAERLRGQGVAAGQLKARTLQLERREAMLAKVLTEARKELLSVQQWGDYDQIAHQLLREALSHLGAPSARIRADGATLRLLREAGLEALTRETGMQLEFAEPLKEGIGVIVETPDGHLHYDNTLQTRLDRLENSLRLPVYQILQGEAL